MTYRHFIGSALLSVALCAALGPSPPLDIAWPRALLSPSTCLLSTLRVVARWGAAVNQLFGYVLVTNQGAQACTLRGYPSIRLVSPDGQTLRVYQEDGGMGVDLVITQGVSPGDQRHGLLRPGRRAYVALEWANWCRDPVGEPITMVITLSRTNRARVPVDDYMTGTRADAGVHALRRVSPVRRPLLARGSARTNAGRAQRGLARLVVDGLFEDGQALAGLGVADVEGGDQAQHLLAVAAGEQQQAVLDAAMPRAHSGLPLSSEKSTPIIRPRPRTSAMAAISPCSIRRRARNCYA